jgi:cell division protein FtsI (penicillin-binding protein 3)
VIRSRRIGFVHLILALFAVAILLRAGEVQLVQGNAWSARAERQQSSERDVPAPRGEILDGSHRVLAESHNMVRVAIAPNEVRDRDALARALSQAGVSRDVVSHALDTRLKWVPIAKPFLAMDIAPALRLAGVHTTPIVARSYVMSEGTRRLVGHVNRANQAVDGLELALDSVLQGHDGLAMLLRNSRGQSFESPTEPGVAATPGSTVVLTINSDLQEIIERALADAIARLGADGGDIVVLDPFDGDILAMASQRLDPRSTSATALTEPFEPGSTMKPLIAAGLLQDHLVTSRDSVDTGNGVLEINGRTIHDEHELGRVPLADVLRWSSNIGIVKFAERFTPAQEYETLRNFGLGSITGVPYPTESAGRLREPETWSRQSANSMAMGYEVSVTPLQLALAYAAIANGGELLEPALVSQIIAPDGTVQYRRERRVVRRVLTPEVANRVRQMLVGVVDGGTALSASIANYELAGKTGTPRGTLDGRYVVGRHNPNFAGIFPANAPQFVIVVKLAMPQGAGYSAETAAPLTRAVLQAAIASRDAALDRGKLASSAQPPRDTTQRDTPPRGIATTVEQAGAAESVPPPSDATREVAPAVAVFTLPVTPAAPTPPIVDRAVPDVHGLSLRDAVRSLHSAGFRVQLDRGAKAAAFTTPAAGALAPAGSLIRLTYNY